MPFIFCHATVKPRETHTVPFKPRCGTPSFRHFISPQQSICFYGRRPGNRQRTYLVRRSHCRGVFPELFRTTETLTKDRQISKSSVTKPLSLLQEGSRPIPTLPYMARACFHPSRPDMRGPAGSECRELPGTACTWNHICRAMAGIHLVRGCTGIMRACIQLRI